MSSISTSALKKRVIEESVRITVGDGKDYELITDALRYAEGVLFSGGGELIIELDDGTHIIDENVNSTDWILYNFKDCKITIQSASGDKSLCNVKMVYDNTKEYLDIISIVSGHLYVSGINFDGRDENNLNMKRWLFSCDLSSKMTFRNCSFNHFYAPISGEHSEILLYNDILMTETCTSVTILNGALYQWANNSSGETTSFSNFYEYGEPTTNWVRAISVRGNSYFTSYSDISVFDPPTTDKIFNGFRIDESSRMYVDGTATHKINDCKVAIKIEGGSSVSTEQHDYNIEITDCDTGFQISFDAPPHE